MALAAAQISISALATNEANVAFTIQRFRRRKMRSFHLVRAASSGPEDSSKEEDDARYVLKLGVGSVVVAAVIKYGSVVVPQVTKPNLSEALFIIVTPVIAAVLILLLISRSKTEETLP